MTVVGWWYFLTTTVTAVAPAISVTAVCFGLIFPFVRYCYFQSIHQPIYDNDGIKNLRWRRSPEFFVYLLRLQEPIDCSSWEDDITLGDPDGRVQIILSSNPSCKPCAEAHERLLEILAANYASVRATVRFLISDAENTGKNEVTRSILQRHVQSLRHRPEGLLMTGGEDMVSIWFKSRTIEKFKNAVPLAVEEDVEALMARHQYWSRDANIKSTPTLFINGYALPAGYGINNLEDCIRAVDFWLRNVEPTI